MDCQGYRQNLADGALGVIPPPREVELRAHLAACAACREAFEGQRRLVAAIDRGIRASLAAGPSPEFAARVGWRIAHEPSRVDSWFLGLLSPAWLPVAGGALAALVLLAVWLTYWQAPKPAPTESAKSAAPSRLTPPPAPDSTARGAAVAPGRRRGRRGQQLTQPFLARAAAPEVLVPPGQREAVLRFYAAVRSQRADAASLLRQSPPLVPAELKIAPLEIAELDLETNSPLAQSNH